MKKKIPTFETDAQAEHFVDAADLTDYDLSRLKLVRFKIEKEMAETSAIRSKSDTDLK